MDFYHRKNEEREIYLESDEDHIFILTSLKKKLTEKSYSTFNINFQHQSVGDYTFTKL